MKAKPRIAVVSPFLDKRHGTERCVAEQIERLAQDYEIHVYSTSIQDVDPSKIIYRHIPRLPGPHLARYIWFFLANHFRRWWDGVFRGLRFDLVFSPGINCLDADVIAVHIVFTEFYRLAHQELALRQNPVRMWPWLIHRQLSYHLFMALERGLYARDKTLLAVTSHKMEEDLERCFGRKGRMALVYDGVDLDQMNPARRENLREKARRDLRLPEDAFAILLIGNDWKKKGLRCLIEAVGSLSIPHLCILVVGDDKSFSYPDILRRSGLENRMTILPIVPQVESYYAAADMYAGPSIEDSFAMPPLEAMACGLPVIVSRQAGVSELVTHGVDGFVLEDPTDSRQLAELIHRIYTSADLRRELGVRAEATARHYTWQRNAEEMGKVFEGCLREKGRDVSEASRQS
ncbi:MAG: glycosyltransferase family 4 protein [Candidatus Acidiferrales bacterium]|jgi:UDP-glucose:(heptosyl)LPS alpha-1,3-glucosyltransferase